MSKSTEKTSVDAQSILVECLEGRMVVMNSSDFISARCKFCGAGFARVSVSGKTIDFHCGTQQVGKVGTIFIRSIDCYEAQVEKLTKALKDAYKVQAERALRDAAEYSFKYRDKSDVLKS